MSPKRDCIVPVRFTRDEFKVIQAALSVARLDKQHALAPERRTFFRQALLAVALAIVETGDGPSFPLAAQLGTLSASQWEFFSRICESGSVHVFDYGESRTIVRF